MRTLYVYRHAKASRDDPTLKDHERPLTERGRHDAARMASHAKQLKIEPELIWCSTSKRTRETLEPMRPMLKHASVEHDDWLYQATPEDIIENLRDVDDSVGSVMVVGHNPTFQELVLDLAKEGDALPQVREKMATGSIAIVELPIDAWGTLQPGTARLRAYIEPKQLH